MATLISNPMQRDTELFESFDSSDKSEPVLFFYTWDEVAISIGKIQRNRQALINEAAELGIPSYIRPTGGRAVLHGGDICYTFIAPQNHPEFGGKLCQSFKSTNNYICRVIASVAKQSRLLMNTSNFWIASPAARNDDSNSFNCFDTAINSEVIVDGHKIIGAAQAMGKRAFIQQGSIQLNKVDCDLPYFKENKCLEEITGEKYDLEALVQELMHNMSIN